MEQSQPQETPKKFDPYSFTHSALVKDISQETDITQFFVPIERSEYENIINLCVKAKIVGIPSVLFPLSIEVVTALNQKGFDTKMGQKCHSCQGAKAQTDHTTPKTSSSGWLFSASSENSTCPHTCGQFTRITIPLDKIEKKEEKK